MDDESLRTPFDELLSSLKRAGSPVSAHGLSEQCNMPEGDVLKWLHVLERSGHVQLENKLDGIYANWTGKAMKEKEPEHRKHREAQASTLEIDIARGHEKTRGKPPEIHEMEEPPEVHKIKLQVDAADMEMADVGEQLEKIEEMIAKLKQQRERKERLEEQAAIEPVPEETSISEDENLLLEPEAQEEIPAPKIKQKAKEEKREIPVKPASQKEPAPEEEKEELQSAAKIKPMEKLPPSVSAKIQILPVAQKKERKEPIKRPQPVRIEPQSFQFSDRLAAQVRKIIEQTQEIDKLRLEKERILKEHYLPMQRKLDIEVETISDRVLRMEKGILSMQERAAALPSKVTATEKLQQASIKAHREMRRAYDEASALIEEATGELAGEREKMELIIDQSRQEISHHSAKREELERSLSRIEEMEEKAEQRVIEARSALAEQAERLSSAEHFLGELSSLKDEIHGSVGELKAEISTTKGILTGVQKQMEQMRQVELWSESIRQDYDTKMADLDDYIRHGNQEFDTLRESVETNFVRRYLRELRQLTDSYSYEFDQARGMEKSVEERITEERGKLEGLLEEGKKIAQLYEMQSKEVPGSEKFEERGEMFRSLSQIASERQQIEQMISQIVGKKTELEQKVSAKVASSPIKTRTYSKQKSVKMAKAKSAKKSAPKKAKGKKGKKR